MASCPRAQWAFKQVHWVPAQRVMEQEAGSGGGASLGGEREMGESGSRGVTRKRYDEEAADRGA